MDAPQLLLDAHGRCLRMLAAAADEHFEGLAQASRCRRLALPPLLRRRLRDLDVAAAYVRHITAPRVTAMLDDLTAALGAATDELPEHDEVAFPLYPPGNWTRAYTDEPEHDPDASMFWIGEYLVDSFTQTEAAAEGDADAGAGAGLLLLEHEALPCSPSVASATPADMTSITLFDACENELNHLVHHMDPSPCVLPPLAPASDMGTSAAVDVGSATVLVPPPATFLWHTDVGVQTVGDLELADLDTGPTIPNTRYEEVGVNTEIDSCVVWPLGGRRATTLIESVIQGLDILCNAVRCDDRVPLVLPCVNFMDVTLIALLECAALAAEDGCSAFQGLVEASEDFLGVLQVFDTGDAEIFDVTSVDEPSSFIGEPVMECSPPQASATSGAEPERRLLPPLATAAGGDDSAVLPPPPPLDEHGDPLVKIVVSDALAALVRRSHDVETSAERLRSRALVAALFDELVAISEIHGELVRHGASVDVWDSEGPVQRLMLGYLLECVSRSLLRSRGGRGLCRVPLQLQPLVQLPNGTP